MRESTDWSKMLRMFLGDQVSQATSTAFDSMFCTTILACLILLLILRKRSRCKDQPILPSSAIQFSPDICLSIKSWQTKEAVAQIVAYLKSEGIRVCVIRKKGALNKFIEKAQQEGAIAVVQKLIEVQRAHQAIITSVNDDGEEDWNTIKIIAAESDVDDLVDGFMVSDTGRVARLN